MDFKPYHMLVFSTNKTLNERFTPKNERCVFVANNGDSPEVKDSIVPSFCNTSDKRNVLVSEGMETDEICPTSNQTNVEENAEIPINLLARREQYELKPANFKGRNRSQMYKNLINLTGPKDMWNDNFRVNRRFIPLRSQPRYCNSRLSFRGARRYCRDKRFRGYNERYKRRNSSNFGLFRRYRYIRPFSYRWGRRRTLITKEQLDDEIDKYMADVIFSAPYIKTDKCDANENILNETEQFLKNCVKIKD